ncbi:MAG: glycosyltransferase family 4 protein [Woeseiaceae bacterium]
MRIAIIGLRAIGPTALGGIESVIEELSTRFVKKGHHVTVFVRGRYAQDVGENFKGVHLKVLPAIYTKHLEAITNTVVAIFYALRGYDIVHINALGPALLSFIPRLFFRNVVVTVHGQDWKREKWGGFAKWVLRIGERAAVTFPQRTVVVSKTLKDYEEKKFGKKVIHIPNGVMLPAAETTGDANTLGLKKNEFILFLGRLVPEKGCHVLIEAFRQLKTDKKLVIAGAPSHSEDYANQLHELARDDDRIIFAGPLYEEHKEEAYRNAYCFVLPSSIEGMAIVLLEAMSYAKCCLCSDIEENLEVIFPSVTSEHARQKNDRFIADQGTTSIDEMFGACFSSGDVDDLTRKLEFLFRHPELVNSLGERARQQVADRHNWDRIAQEYLVVFSDLLKQSDSHEDAAL